MDHKGQNLLFLVLFNYFYFIFSIVFVFCFVNVSTKSPDDYKNHKKQHKLRAMIPRGKINYNSYKHVDQCIKKLMYSL